MAMDMTQFLVNEIFSSSSEDPTEKIKQAIDEFLTKYSDTLNLKGQETEELTGLLINVTSYKGLNDTQLGELEGTIQRDVLSKNEQDKTFNEKVIAAQNNVMPTLKEIKPSILTISK